MAGTLKQLGPLNQLVVEVATKTSLGPPMIESVDGFAVVDGHHLAASPIGEPSVEPGVIGFVDLDDLAKRVVGGEGRAAGEGIDGLPVALSGADELFAPAVGFFSETSDREGIDEFVRVEAGVALARYEGGLDVGVPLNPSAQSFLLLAAQRRRAFDQVQGGAEAAVPGQCLQNGLGKFA